MVCSWLKGGMRTSEGLNSEGGRQRYWWYLLNTVENEPRMVADRVMRAYCSRLIH